MISLREPHRAGSSLLEPSRKCTRSMIFPRRLMSVPPTAWWRRKLAIARNDLRIVSNAFEPLTHRQHPSALTLQIQAPSERQ
ncbi:hypothetical protein B9Z19DRAFT_444766 [Tuber borchii]|uniref:Uncharacterized protein n=1 Tax=Tuber borchii TaxID=42251 RepID=A0A2T6ZG37_TUBBO|nr:hypothetical protein B9Z19DRAFT_444766 [Tuber borchii]